MSECVVRMEMPESCKKCRSTICLWVKDDDLDYIDVIEKVQDFRKKNNDVGFPDFCPIVCSLPEGHGRLVDASWKIYIMQVPVTVDDASRIVHALPTIVPAERREE